MAPRQTTAPAAAPQHDPLVCGLDIAGKLYCLACITEQAAQGARTCAAWH